MHLLTYAVPGVVPDDSVTQRHNVAFHRVADVSESVPGECLSYCPVQGLLSNLEELHALFTDRPNRVRARCVSAPASDVCANVNADDVAFLKNPAELRDSVNDLVIYRRAYSSGKRCHVRGGLVVLERRDSVIGAYMFLRKPVEFAR